MLPLVLGVEAGGSGERAFTTPAALRRRRLYLSAPGEFSGREDDAAAGFLLAAPVLRGGALAFFLVTRDSVWVPASRIGTVDRGGAFGDWGAASASCEDEGVPGSSSTIRGASLGARRSGPAGIGSGENGGIAEQFGGIGISGKNPVGRSASKSWTRWSMVGWRMKQTAGPQMPSWELFLRMP